MLVFYWQFFFFTCFIDFVMRINFNLQQMQFKNNNQKIGYYFSSPFKQSYDCVSFGSSFVDTKAKNYKDDIEMYKTKMLQNPKMAFLYNPDVPKKVREEQADLNPTIKTPVALANYLKLNSYAPIIKWLNDDKFDYDLIPRTAISSAYIDLENDKNAEFISCIQEKSPGLKDFRQLLFEYNISLAKLSELLADNKLKPYEAEYDDTDGLNSYVFDLNDENNLSAFDEHLKLTPIPSKKYYKARRSDGIIKPIYVPVMYLSNLGYSSAQNLAQMIKKGVLPGIYEKIDTPQGKKARALVDIAPYSQSEEKLRQLRNANSNIISTINLAKKLKIRKVDLDEAIKNDEFKIIGEYIFPEDSKKVLVDLSDEKTRVFVDKKLFENRILQEQRKQEAKVKRIEKARVNSPMNSLRMEIVWALCPKTATIASDIAKKDGYVSSIIAKNVPDEELPPKEQVVLAKYRKRFWDAAGIEEFKAAQKMASKYMKIYKTQGIDAVDNPIIREIFEEFENNLVINC